MSLVVKVWSRGACPWRIYGTTENVASPKGNFEYRPVFERRGLMVWVLCTWPEFTVFQGFFVVIALNLQI
jgi:hypothetical protein